VRADPVRKVVFGQAPSRERDHFGDDVVLGGIEVHAVDAEAGDHRKESDALVAVPVRMVSHEAEGISGRKRSIRVLLNPAVWQAPGEDVEKRPSAPTSC